MLRDYSYAYESGLFSPILPLLKVAEDYCNSHQDCEDVMIEIYYAKGSLYTETNQFQACYDSFVTESHWVRKAIQKGLVKSPDIREVFAWGGLGNGLQSLNKYEDAEKCYRKAFQVWENVPGDRKIYVSVSGELKI